MSIIYFDRWKTSPAGHPGKDMQIFITTYSNATMWVYSINTLVYTVCELHENEMELSRAVKKFIF